MPFADIPSDSDTFTVLAGGHCPDCGGGSFRHGPRGGAAQNVECNSCRARFNLTRYKGQLVFAQRIDSEAEGGSQWLDEGSYNTDPTAGHSGERVAPISVAVEVWMGRHPSIPWGEPVAVTWPGETLFACRVCIAEHGLTRHSAWQWPTRDEALQHVKDQHS